VSFGQHRGQHELWRGARRRWWCDAGEHIGGNLVEHLIAGVRRQLAGTVEKLAGQVGLIAGEPGQL